MICYWDGPFVSIRIEALIENRLGVVVAEARGKARMRKWLAVGLLAVVGAAGGYLWLCRYRLTPLSALGVDGQVLRKKELEGGESLLVKTEQDGCFVGQVHRVGLLWESMGAAWCDVEPHAPFRHAGWGTRWKPNDGQYVMAFGGVFSDPRVATIRMAGQTAQPVSPETGYLFVYGTVHNFPPAQALAEDGTVLYTLHEGTGWRWVSPEAPPVPERITEQAELPVEAASAVEVQAIEEISSLWRNGEVEIDGQWQPFYVWADGRAEFCGIGTAVSTKGSPWYQAYPCPEPMGALKISGIDETGRIITYEASDGRTGRFNLETLTWEMDGS